MTVSNVSSATSGAIIQAPGNPGALQRSHSLPSARTAQNAYRRLLPRSDSSPARITQNSPESLRAPVAGKVLFRALEETGASSSKVRHVFDIVESGHEAGEKSYQITMSDGLRDSITMKLEVPEGERLESVREKLGEGEYKVKIVHNSEGEQVCQLRENIGLKGGGNVDLPSWWPLGFFRNPSSEDYDKLGDMLKPGDTVCIDGSKMTRTDCYLKAAELSSNKSLPSWWPSGIFRKPSSDDYDRLGDMLELGDRVYVDGCRMSKADCYLKAVELAPNNVSAAKQRRATAKQRRATVSQKEENHIPQTVMESFQLTQLKAGLQLAKKSAKEAEYEVNEAMRALEGNVSTKTIECGVNKAEKLYDDAYRFLRRANENADQLELYESVLEKSDQKELIDLREALGATQRDMELGRHRLQQFNREIQQIKKEKARVQELQLKADELDLEDPDAYTDLANILKPRDSVLIQGREMTQQKLKEKAKELKEKKAKAKTEAEALQRRKDADYCFKLGSNLKSGETVQVWEQDMTKQACFLKALELNPKHSAAFTSLGLTLKPRETVRVKGQDMTAVDCYLKALSLNPKNDVAFSNLALTLDPGKKVRVGEQDMTTLDCCLTALNLNLNNDLFFNKLGTVLEPGTTVEVRGQHMDKQACFLEALNLNPENDMAYVNLGTTLEPGKKVKVNGKKINQRECYLEALRLNPDNDQAYDNLGNTLLTLNEKVRIGGLFTGEKLNKRECYLRALSLNPHSASAYQHLGMTLQEHERVRVFGKEMSKQDCFKKAMELAPSSQNLVHAENYLLHQTSPSPQARKLYDQILTGEKRFDQALMNKELHPAVTNAASLWLMHQMAGTAHSSGSLRPGASEVSKRLYDLYRPGPLLDNLSDEDKYIWQILLQDANNKGLLNRHQTDTIKNTIKINQLENRVDGLRASALKTLNHALNRLQDNQLKLAQSNVAIARQLQLERKIRFYANCASFALAFVPVAGEALASGARLFSDGMLTSMEEGTQDIGKQNIKETLTHIWNNAEQIPAIAEDTGRFLAGEFPAEYDQYATGINAGQKVIGVLEQTAIDKLSERLEKNLKQTASEIQGNTAGPVHFGSPAAARPSGVQAARPAQPSQNVQNVESDADDSGLDSADEDNNRLAALIKRDRTKQFSKALGKSTVDDINKPVIRTRRTHIKSTPLDIAAHYGRAEMAESLEEAGAKSSRHGAPLKAVEIAEEKAKAREAQNSGRR